MTTEEKLAKINAKDFTWCSVFVEHDTEMMQDAYGERPRSEHVYFVVLSGSKPVARQAAAQVFKNVIEPKGWHIHPVAKLYETVRLYPKTYIASARELLEVSPENVYAVDHAEITSVLS